MICLTAAMALFSPMDDGWRPTSEGYVDHDTLPVRCHWEREADEETCADVLDYVALSWAYQVDELGFVAPMLTDDDGILDVYLTNDGTGGGAYVTGPGVDEDGSDGRSGHHAYMALDFGIPDDEMESYVAHEFQHILQYATDFNEYSLPVWEGVAEAAALWTIGGEYAPPGYYGADYQKTPWVGILGDGYVLWDDFDIYSFYEYGSMMAFLHFDATYGGETGEGLVALWAALAQEGDVNEPDVLDAMDELTGDWHGWILEHALERTWVGTEANPDWAEVYEREAFALTPESSLEASELPGTLEPEYAPFATGAVYFSVTGLEAGETVEVEVEEGGEVNWGLVLSDGETHAMVDGSSAEFTSASGADLTIGVVNFAKDTFDVDSPLKQTAAEFVLAVDLASASADGSGSDGDGGDGDDGAGGGGEDPKGCGCAAGGQASAMGFAWLAIIGLARRRR